MLCLCSMNDPRGFLPALDEVSFYLRVSESEALVIIDRLIEAKLIDKSPGSKKLRMHGWEKRQRNSDDVATRVKRYRKRQCNVTCNVTSNGIETLPHACATETETETETDKNPPTPLEGGGVGGDKILDPEVERTGSIVAEMAGDVSWEMWVHNQHRMGCSIKDIQNAIEVCVNKNTWSMPLADGVLKRIARDRAKCNGRGDH